MRSEQLNKVNMIMYFFLLLLLSITVSKSTQNDIVEVDLLVLVPWHEGSSGLGLLPGARIAAQQINNRSDLLPGYRINIIEAGHESCGLTEQYLGLLNVVYFGTNSFRLNKNFGAVLGLYCSTTTASLSAVVGREDVELLQLACANSPIFIQNIDRYPHLWRFLQSASVYADTMIHLIDQYGWNRLAIIASEGSIEHNQIARILLRQLDVNNKKAVDLFIGKVEFVEVILDSLIYKQARIVFISAPSAEIVSFLCSAYERGMGYPNYLWIIPNESLNTLLLWNTCGGNLSLSLERAIFLYFDLIPQNTSLTLEPSNISYNDYLEFYDIELERLKEDYAAEFLLAMNITSSPVYSGLLYDQVWAFALAFNDSLLQLKANNLLDGYKTERTHIIEQNLGNLNFAGISGHIRFNQFREVSTPINVYQVLNGLAFIVGEVSVNYSNVSLNLDDDFNDEVPILQKRLYIGIGIAMGIGSVALLVLTTIIFVLMLKHRNHCKIKAISPMLNVFVFLGCYLMILATILIAIDNLVVFSREQSAIVCSTIFLLIFNGFTFIYVTEFFKLNRLHQIFYNSKLKKLGWIHRNQAIALEVIGLTAIPNVIYIISIAVLGTFGHSFEMTEMTKIVTVTACYRESTVNNMFGFVFTIFLSYMGIRIIYLASKIARISNENMNKTRYTTIFIVLSCVIHLVSFLWNVLIFKRRDAIYIAVSDFMSFFLTVLSCQLFLFVPFLISVYKKT